jgi:hypothetical protein
MSNTGIGRYWVFSRNIPLPLKNKTEKSFSNLAASQFCYSRSNKSTTTLQFWFLCCKFAWLLRYCCVARLHDCCVARFRDCCVVRLRYCCVTRLRDCWVARLRDCSVACKIWKRWMLHKCWWNRHKIEHMMASLDPSLMTKLDLFSFSFTISFFYMSQQFFLPASEALRVYFLLCCSCSCCC